VFRSSVLVGTLGQSDSVSTTRKTVDRIGALVTWRWTSLVMAVLVASETCRNVV